MERDGLRGRRGDVEMEMVYVVTLLLFASRIYCWTNRPLGGRKYGASLESLHSTVLCPLPGPLPKNNNNNNNNNHNNNNRNKNKNKKNNSNININKQ